MSTATPVSIRILIGVLSLLPALAAAQDAAPPNSSADAATEPATAESTVAEEVTEAATSSVDGIEEIFVTAQRKKERLQDVPIAVNVLAGDALQTMGLADTQALQAVVPGLDFTATGSAGTPFLRGVGANAGNPNDEPSVATYIDGVYIAAPFANIMSFNNLQRVEVLKGPQGTLFGRNATGGVIQLVTRDPQQERAVEMQAGYANYRTSSGSLYATGGLSETLAADLAVQADSQDNGWGRNVVLDTESYKSKNLSARSKLLWTPSDVTTLRFSFDHAETDHSKAEYKIAPGAVGLDGQPSPSGKYDTASDITLNDIGMPRVVARQTGVALRAEHEFANFQGVSISAYRHARGEYDLDPDATPAPILSAALPMDQKNFSQELQLLSLPSSTIDWVLGAFYYRNNAAYENANLHVATGVPDPAFADVFITGRQKTDSASVYAQSTVEVVTDTKLTTGLRFTSEDQELIGSANGVAVPSPRERGFDELTWRAALDYAFSYDVHSYVSYNRGVKGGGFDLLTPGSTGFDPELLDAYEIGLKSQLFDRRLRINASVFYYDYKNIQVQVVGGDTAAAVTTENAAKAKISGLDVDFQYAPTRQLTFSGGFAILDSEYKSYENAVSYPASGGDGTRESASGNDTIRTPKFSGAFTTEYRIPSTSGEFRLSATISHNSGYYYSADNRFEQDAYTLLNASAGWNTEDERYGISLWGRNLGGEYYYVQGVPSGFGNIVVPAAPRTYGVTIKANF